MKFTKSSTIKIFTLFVLMLTISSSVAIASRPPGTASIRFDPATISADMGDKFDVQVIIDNPNGESIDSLQLEINYVDSVLGFDPFVAGDQFAFLTGGNCAFANTPVTCAFPTTDVQIGPTIGAGTANVFLASSNAEDGDPLTVAVLRMEALTNISSRSVATLIDFTPGDDTTEIGTLYYTAGSPLTFANLGDVTAVELTGTGTSSTSPAILAAVVMMGFGLMITTKAVISRNR